jgi:DNA replicative helicase MCM subunit Mcm2 (Cdc46/Mcm family)
LGGTAMADNKSQIYFITDCEGLVKIGISQDPKKRINDFKSGNHRKFKILHTFPGDRDIEFFFHRLFAHYQVNREWFKIEGLLKEFIERKYIISNFILQNTEVKPVIPEKKDRDSYVMKAENASVLKAIKIGAIQGRYYWEGVNRFEIFQRMAEGYGFPENKTDKILTRLLDDGLIYRPKGGFYCPIWSEEERKKFEAEYDEEESKIDKDKIDRTPKSGRDNFKMVLHTVKRIEDDFGGKAPLKVILNEIWKQGMSEGKLIEVLRVLKRNGSVYEPKEGYWKVV